MKQLSDLGRLLCETQNRTGLTFKDMAEHMRVSVRTLILLRSGNHAWASKTELKLVGHILGRLNPTPLMITQAEIYKAFEPYRCHSLGLQWAIEEIWDTESPQKELPLTRDQISPVFQRWLTLHVYFALDDLFQSHTRAAFRRATLREVRAVDKLQDLSSRTAL